MSCPKCGEPISSISSKFCLKCGGKFTPGSAPSTPTKPSAPSPTTTATTTTPSSAPPTPTKPASVEEHSSPDSSPSRKDGCFCHGCKGIIVGNMAEDSKGNRFHPSCFVCASCSTRITASYAYDDKGRITCDTCARKQLQLTGEDVCHKCAQKIVGEAVFVVGNNRFHKACFICVQCGISVEGQAFTSTDTGLMCKPCALKAKGMVCAGCHQLVEKNGLRALDKIWHESCFVCHKCKKGLYQLGQYYPEGDHAYCPDCSASPDTTTTTTTTATTATTTSAPPQAKFCGNCGSPAAGGKFCSECGHGL